MTDRDHRKLHEEIMRGAEERMRKLALEVLRREREARKKYNVKLNDLQLQKDDKIRCVVEQIEHEIASLAARRDRTSNIAKRVEFKAAMVHLRETIARLKGQNRRRPPEAGIAMPAVPPSGPLPKQGGAEAPLDFDA